MRETQHWPRSGSTGLGAGRGVGGGGVAWRALRTAASPTTAEVVDAANLNAGALDGSSDEGGKRGGLAGGVGLVAVPGGLGEERTVNGGGASGRVQERSSSNSRPTLPAQGSPEAAALMVTEAKKLSSTASALMRRMTNAGKQRRWVWGCVGWQWWR